MRRAAIAVMSVMKKVPGLEAGKIDALRFRVVF